MDLLGVDPEEVMKILRGMKHLCYGDRLRELGVLSLERWPDGSPEALRAPPSA